MGAVEDPAEEDGATKPAALEAAFMGPAMSVAEDQAVPS